LESAGHQLADLRTQLSTELERARELVVFAQERAEEASGARCANWVATLRCSLFSSVFETREDDRGE
jgi:hypothetical protein